MTVKKERITNIQEKFNEEPKIFRKQLTRGILFLILLYLCTLSIEYKGLKESGLAIGKNIIWGILTPDLEFLFNFTKQGVPYLILETISIAFLGTLLGAILAIPFAFLSSKNIVPKYISSIGVTLIAVIRTFPAFVYGLMFIRVAGPGPFTGVLTLSLVSIGMISKLYIEAIEDLDKGILESLDAAGCNGFEKIRYGIIPQLFTNFVSTVIYRFEINVKNAAVLGLVGAGGIGAPLIFAMSSYRWHQVGSILIGLIVVVLIIEHYSSKIRNKLARG